MRNDFESEPLCFNRGLMTEPHYKSLSKNLRGFSLFFCGLFMGIADLIPGISGGTIAFILGFYQPLIASLKTLNGTTLQLALNGKWVELKNQIAWRFLVTLLSGMGIALFLFAHIVHVLLAHEYYRVYLYATFLGLILASFLFCIKQIQKWNPRIIFGLFLGAIAAYSLSEAVSFNSSAEGNYSVEIHLDHQNVSIKNYEPNLHLLTGLSIQGINLLISQGFLQESSPVYNHQNHFVGLVGDFIVPNRMTFYYGWLMFCGAIAICALLLPGISGSYILTLLGVYPAIMEALSDLTTGLMQLSLNTNALSVLGSVSVGILLGTLMFARGLSYILNQFPDQTMAVLSGFMIGAIRSVWPFWTYEYALLPFKLHKGPQLVLLQPYLPQWDSPLIWQSLGCTCIGFLLAISLELYSNASKSRKYEINGNSMPISKKN